MPWIHRKLVFSLMLGTWLLLGTRVGLALALTISWLPLMAASSRAFMCGAEAMKALKTAGCWGPRRIRSCRADSCREHEASGAVARVFSSSRKETRMGNSTATNWSPTPRHSTNISVGLWHKIHLFLNVNLFHLLHIQSTLCRTQLQNMFKIINNCKESFQTVQVIVFALNWWESFCFNGAYNKKVGPRQDSAFACFGPLFWSVGLEAPGAGFHYYANQKMYKTELWNYSHVSISQLKWSQIFSP